MITGIIEVTQDPEQAGSTLKILSLRLRGMKGQLEELGEETDENVENISKMQGQILNLTNGKVNIFDGAGEFRSTYEIMKDISEVWDNLNSTAQADLLETIAGKHRANSVAALLSNWQNVEAAVKSATEAEGSAVRENAKYVDSIQGRLDKLTTVWQSFANTVMNSNFLKGGISFITSMLEGVEKLIDTLGVIPTLITAFSAVQSFRGHGFFKIILDEATGTATSIENVFSKAFSAIKNFAINTFKKNDFSFESNGFNASLAEDESALMRYKLALDEGMSKQDAFNATMQEASPFAQNFAQTMEVTGASVANFSEQQRKTQLAMQASDKSLTNVGNLIRSYGKSVETVGLTQQQFVESVQQTNPHLAKYLSGLNGAKGSLGGYITSLVGAKVATIGLQIATTALNAVIGMGIGALVSVLISGITKWINAEKDLAEKVDELTSKYKEQHKELQRIKGDYDTSNESSMISRYEKLSRGVGRFGENISLTAEEYSEYQSIVNQIAEQIPSLVSGYDSQGNALLSCKDNVEALTQAYEDMISAQNKAILTNAGKIGEDFANKVEDNNYTGFWGTNLSEDVVSIMEKDLDRILKLEDGEDFVRTYYGSSNGISYGRAIEEALENAGLAEFDKWSYDYIFNYDEVVAEAFEEAVKTNPKAVQDIIDGFYAGLEADAAEMKNIAQATLSDAFDISDSKYYDMSDTMQSVAKNIVNGFDYEFYKQYKDNSSGVQTYINNMLDQLKSMSDIENASIEASFDLQTQFNGGEISYGEYVKGLEDAGKTIDGLISSGKLDKEIGTQIKFGIGLDEKGLVAEYQRLRNRLADSAKFNISEPQYESFIEGLSADELSVVWDVIPRLEKTSYKETIADIKAALEREMMLQGLTFELNLETETAGIEALNTALAESVTGSGLSSESISALKSRYADLEAQGYDLSSMFEETSHGVHLNRAEFNKLEKAYATQKLTEVNGQLGEMQSAYDQLGEDIRNCTDPVEKAKLFSDRQLLAQRISEAATLASEYQGLTSAYNDWLAAEESGQERGMYEQVIEGFENVGDEISRGWYDDGTIKFLELITGETDLASKSASELKKIWKGLDNNIENTSYSVKDFFTVDEDGNSTSTGVYNFLRALQELESSNTKSSVLNKAFKEIENIEDLVTVKDGKITKFNFDVVGGEKAVADALEISEELVQIIMRAADDAGFVINMDGAYQQLADLQNEAKSATNYLNELFKEDYSFDFNTSNLDSLNKDLKEAKDILNKTDKNGKKLFWNDDGTFNFNVDGATEAMTIVSTLQAKIDSLTSEQYGIGLTVEDEKFEESLENLQEYGRKIATLNQLKLNPKTNAAEIEKLNGELDGIAKEFAELPDETKVEIGLVGANGQAFTEEYFNSLSRNSKIKMGLVGDDGKPIDNYIDAVQKKIESGEIEIPTILDIQANMDKNLETLADLALLNSGLLSDSEEAIIRKKYKVELEDNTDNENNKQKVNKTVKAVTADGDEEPSVVKKDFELVAEVADSDVSEKVDETVSNENNETSVVKKDVELVSEVADSNIGEKVDEAVEEESNKTEKVEQTVEVDLIAERANDLKIAELIKDYTPEKQKVIVEYFAEHDEVDEYTPEQKEVLVEFIANSDNLDSYTPEEKQAIVEYLTDSADPDSWTPEQKEAVAKFIRESGDVDSYTPAQKEAIAKFIRDSIDPDTYSPPNPTGTVTFLKDANDVETYDPPNFTRYVTYYAKKAFSTAAEKGEKVLENRFGIVNGTANVNGTTGRAFKQGSWGTKNSGTALVGELGREVLVRDGRYYTIGDNGAEFIKYKQGDIIFNHVQSEELFKNGKVTSGGGRAKAFTNGTALLQGTAFVNSGGVGGGEEPDPDDTNSEDKFEETIDWIETILDRAERAIDKYEKQANNIYKTWAKRNKALENEIAEVGSTISLYEQAKNKYLSEANAVGLNESYASKVRNGSLNIEDFEGESDEKLVEKIKNYQDLYEKYLDCIDKIEELKEQEASLYAQRFENVQSEYDNLLQGFDHTQSMLDEYINQAEAKGHIVSKNYYTALIDNEENRINTLKQEQAALIKARDEAVANDEFDKYSEEWYNMCAEIDAVTQEIESGTTALIEYNNAIRDIDFEVFELIQERISDITAEADFLIELMSHKDLFDDKGNLTDQGQVTIGLRGQNYNTYMYQADEYGAKVAEIDRKIASGELDGYSDTVLDKRREYIELQRECILNAEQEKESIRSLIEEGIETELDSLGELIDTYQDALQSQKDLYDYQKRVEEQTKNISSIQKQLTAYEGDNSEEAKAKIQELRVSLEEAENDLAETEFEHYIDQQEQLLTSLFDEYELMLNERIDNLDYLIAQQIEAVNANALAISETLSAEADAVGYTLSSAMTDIWNGEQAVLTMYGEDFKLSATNINTTLNGIKTSIDNMVVALNKEAEKKIEQPKTTTFAKKDPVKTTTNNNKTNNDNKKDPKANIKSSTLMGIAAAIWNYQKENYGGWGADPIRQKRLTDKLGATNAKKVQSYINAYGATGRLYNVWISNGKNLDKYKYSAFKLGAKNIDETQLAWTQENGQEYIIRPSDGAILTPVAKGDSVLTSAATNNIWSMANSPAEFIKDNLNLSSTSVPNNSTVQNSYSQHIDNVVFRMDNVKNYDEMLTQMQRDPNFERLVESMSIGKLAGKSSLAKGKAIR